MDATDIASWYRVQPDTSGASGPGDARRGGREEAPGISSDFDTFLKMLTTQMQNQDPLNPMESTDFAVQLATFSGVEQQTRTNQLLQGLEGQFALLGMAQLAAWVGQEARHAGPVGFGGDPVTLLPGQNPQADRTVLVVTDAAGTVVGREDIIPGTEEFLWEGQSITGAPLPPGQYRLSVEQYREGAFLGSGPVESYGRILEAQGGAGGNRLVLAGGVTLDATEITALRMAP
ncbi:flagellar hook capping FlgD N-terminal domain-containing protein [Szabonella alba]|uniref:Basal-body rod modification protein FlgD n=1 Tax=Szabonella alba TaxID=2804194 RepID=A0A8K0V766_9RHOB|nr:flagellar hook capping FlgD N-terminal domain-containing protein [Szabonella alba]MBL4917004.1 flagellar hook assembly protein FlgD [Szabonella alba]